MEWQIKKSRSAWRGSAGGVSVILEMYAIFYMQD